MKSQKSKLSTLCVATSQINARLELFTEPTVCQKSSRICHGQQKDYYEVKNSCKNRNGHCCCDAATQNRTFPVTCNRGSTISLDTCSHKRTPSGFCMNNQKELTYQQSCATINIHGVQEIIYAPNIWLKIVWILLFSVSFGAFCYQTCRTLTEFISEPAASEVSFKVPNTFPEVMYCPREFVNHTRAEKLGITPNIYRYIMSLFPLVSRELKVIINPDDQSLDEVQTKGREFRNQFYDLVQKQGITSLDDLLKSIAKDSDFLTDIRGHMFWYNPKVDIFNTIVDVCYRINKSFPTLDQLQVTLGELSFEVIQFEPHYLPARRHDRFYIGQETIFPVGEIAVKPGYEYTLLLNALWTKKIPTSKRPCRDWKVQDYDQCLLSCFNDQGASSCFLYIPGSEVYSKIHNGTRHCSTFLVADHLMYGKSEFRESSDHCHTRCSEPCSMWVYGATVITAGLYDPSDWSKQSFAARGAIGRSILTLRYANPLISLSITEFKTYTLETLLCNLGGVNDCIQNCCSLAIKQNVMA